MEVDEAVPQCQILDEVDGGASQIENSAGGFVWQIDDMTRFRRFLVLGSESPTYYIGERQLRRDNAVAILSLLRAGRGVEVVNEILTYSIEGRTVKQNPIILSLAMCARLGNLETKQKAYAVMSQICRIPTHLFMFVGYCETLSQPTTGWGRAHRNALRKWYLNKEPMKLAQEITKYQKREGWSHKDIARLMHLKPEGAAVPDELFCIMKYIAKGWEGLDSVMAYYFPEPNPDEPPPVRRSISQGTNTILEYLKAVEVMKGLQPDDVVRVVELIETHKLVREHVPTPCLNLVEVWRALLKKMPLTAMIRNLGKMTKIGLLLNENSPETMQVCAKLRDVEVLRRARIHPFSVLVALKTYADGHGDKGSLIWVPNELIVRALEDAFYLAFKNVQPANKRCLLALDVSGSMSYVGCAGTPCITPKVASAAMSMVTARTESEHHFIAFSNFIVPLDIHQSMRLEEVLEVMENIPMGGTDCALPMTYALENNLNIDVFVVFTDCETKAGKIHPCEALKRYRKHSGIADAKLIVVAMTSNGFTIADPNDLGMFDMAGFDSAAPQVMKEFMLGNI